MNHDWTTSQAVIGEALRRVRIESGCSLRELSKMSGVSASQILRLESGEFDVRLSTLTKIADCLGVPPGLVLEQGISIRPGYYAKILGQNGVPRIGLSKEEKRRSNPTLFYTACCVAIARLLRSSNPPKTVRAINIPVAMRKVFVAIAERFDALYFLDRVSVLQSLSRDPIQVFEDIGLSSDILTASFLNSEKEELERFTGVPDWFWYDPKFS